MLELLQAEEDLILRFPWAGTLTTEPLTKKKNTTHKVVPSPLPLPS